MSAVNCIAYVEELINDFSVFSHCTLKVSPVFLAILLPILWNFLFHPNIDVFFF